MILDDLKAKLIEYTKTKDTYRLGVLRYFLAQVTNKEIELRPRHLELTDEIVFKVLRKQIKDRRDLIEFYTKADKLDQVAKEEEEKKVLEGFAKLFPFELDFTPKIPQK